ncbi:MAG TPA: hypothetical protein VFJ91_05510 [Gaiellaceae bacterium]|nr:hypothetical protein [Gaiellaceae bacterium]
MFNWLRQLTARNTQGDDPTELDRRDDPRGGVQTDEYRHAGPDDVVEEGGTVMAGPGGAPQEDTTPDERRAQDR